MTAARRTGGSAVGGTSVAPRCVRPGRGPRHRRACGVRRLALGSLALFLLVLAPAVAHAQTEVVEYYATDALGSIRVVYDANGVELGRADYLPFGEELSSSAGLPSERFTGQARDGEVGQDYFHARMYGAATGRLNSADPVYNGLFEPQRWNRYAYALNAPLTYADVLGLDACKPGTDPKVNFCTEVKVDQVKIDTGSGGWFWVYVPVPPRQWYLPIIPTGPRGPTGGGGASSDGGGGGSPNPPGPTGPAPPPGPKPPGENAGNHKEGCAPWAWSGNVAGGVLLGRSYSMTIEFRGSKVDGITFTSGTSVGFPAWLSYGTGANYNWTVPSSGSGFEATLNVWHGSLTHSFGRGGVFRDAQSSGVSVGPSPLPIPVSVVLSRVDTFRFGSWSGCK